MHAQKHPYRRAFQHTIKSYTPYKAVKGEPRLLPLFVGRMHWPLVACEQNGHAIAAGTREQCCIDTKFMYCRGKRERSLRIRSTGTAAAYSSNDGHRRHELTSGVYPGDITSLHIRRYPAIMSHRRRFFFLPWLAIAPDRIPARISSCYIYCHLEAVWTTADGSQSFQSCFRTTKVCPHTRRDGNPIWDS